MMEAFIGDLFVFVVVGGQFWIVHLGKVAKFLGFGTWSTPLVFISGKSNRDRLLEKKKHLKNCQKHFPIYSNLTHALVIQ
jgi:hypothetical protein